MTANYQPDVGKQLASIFVAQWTISLLLWYFCDNCFIRLFTYCGILEWIIKYRLSFLFHQELPERHPIVEEKLQVEEPAPVPSSQIASAPKPEIADTGDLLDIDVCCVGTRPLWWDWDITLGDVSLGINLVAYSRSSGWTWWCFHVSFFFLADSRMCSYALQFDYSQIGLLIM